MHKKLKKGTALFMALLIFTAMLAPSQEAFANSVTDGEKAAIETRCKALQEKIAENAAGEYGLLCKLKAVLEYQMYVKFIYDNRLGFTKNEIENYVGNLRRYIKAFNEMYGKKPKQKSFTPLKLGQVKVKKDPGMAIRGNVCDKIPKYVEDILESVQKDVVQGKTDAEKERAMKKSDTILRMCFDILSTYDETITELTNQSALSSNGGEKELFIIDGTKDNSKITQVLSAIREKYTELLEYGEALSANYHVTGSISDIDVTKPAIEIFSNASTDEDGNLVFNGEPELNASYMALISASSVYRPFESYVGAEEFLASVSYLCSSEKAAAKLCSAYASTKDYRKPLYRRKLNQAGEPTGVAEIITLQEFLDAIVSGESFALVSIDGIFKLNQDTQTWVYSTAGPEETKDPAGEAEETDDALDTDDTEGEPAAGNDTTASNSMLKTIYRSHQNKAVATNGSTPATNGFNDMESLYSNVAEEFDEEPKEDDADDSNPAATPSQTNYDTAYKKARSETTIDAYEEITDIARMSEPLLLFGSSKARAVDNMTTAILTNVLKNIGTIDSIKNRDTRFVYVNPYGDIVLDDNLVLLPGIANPIFWKDGGQYVPYNAAIMNNYPSALYNHSFFKLYNSSDIGKYMFFGESSSSQSLLTDKEVSYTGYSLYRTRSLDGFDEKQLFMPELDLEFEMSDGSEDSLELLRTKTFLYNSGTDFTPGKLAPFVRITNETVNGSYVFPYRVEEDPGFSLAKIIVSNMYNKLMHDERSKESKNQGRLNDNYVIQNILQQQLDGTSNPEAYSKNALLQYDSFVKNTPERMKTNIANVANGILEYAGDVDGIIGIKDTYTLHIVGRLFNAIRENIAFILVLIAIFVVICFIKNNNSLFNSILVGALSMAVAYVFIIVVPVYLPYIYNSITNNVSQPLAFETLGTQLEKESIYPTANLSLDAKRNVNLTASSISLYRYPFYDLSGIEKNLSLDDMDEATGGNSYVINEDSGVYLENSTIKVSLSSLMGTLKIDGGYASEAGNGVYQLKAYKTASNNIDFYTPYYQMVDGFIDKLNTLIEVYRVPRTVSTYAKGTQRDKFAVNCYLTSAPFVTPGKYSSMIDYEQEKAAGLTDEEIKECVEYDEQLEDVLTKAYGNNDDWLGITDVIEAPTLTENADLRGTLWAAELQKQGYYDENWKLNTERCAELVGYVNYVTKKFVYDIEDLTTKLSDDTLIKLITLRALLALNQHASDAVGKMYPLFVNYDNFKLGGIMTAVYTDDFQSFASMDMDVANYVIDKYGMLSLLFYVIAVLEIVVFSFIVRILFPLIYVSFGALLLAKLFSNRNIHPLVRGYFKFSAFVFAEFSLFCVSLTLIRQLRSSFISIIFLFLIMTALVWLLFKLLLSWFEDKANLGNSSFNVSVVDAFAKAKNRIINSMTVRRAVMPTDSDNSMQEDTESSGFSEYAGTASVDDLYKNAGTYTSGADESDFDDYGGD